LFLFNSTIFSTLFAQTSTGISITFPSEVGCQVFGNIEDPRLKAPITIESIQDGDCIRVCEESTLLYTLIGLEPSNTTTWNVSGGIIISQTSTTCNINWGNAGIASLEFTIATDNGVVNKTICIEKIAKPISLFNVFPQSPDPRFIMACVDQTLYFTNLSSPNGGTALISPYFWEFGDGSYSTAFEPNHSYSSSGEYQVSLTVSNSCNCSTRYSMNVKVIMDIGFEIICPGVVCENELTSYSLPQEVQDAFTQYEWTADGGVITNLNNNTGEVTVNWNDVNETGFGYLTFDPSKCGLKCYVPSTLKIPVIKKKGTIIGSTNICFNQQTIFKMPQWPTTDFRWKIVGNENGDLAEVILSDQRNEVIIRPIVLGSLILRCTYTNTLLDCGGSAILDLTVEGALPIVGNPIVCENTTEIYHTDNNIATNWTLKSANGQVLNTANSVVNYSYSFNVVGNFTLTAGSSNTCGLQEFLITVAETPNTILSNEVKVLANGIQNLASTFKVCPNAPYTYSLLANPMYQYEWTVTNGLINGSNVGNQVAITFTGVAPAQVSIVRKSINPTVCSSLPTLLTIPIDSINAEIVSITNPNSIEVCANSSAQYKVNNFGTNNTYIEGENYYWSISNPLLGSITSGQNSNTVTILWNNVSANTMPYPTINVTITKCTIVQTISTPVIINPIPIIAIVATPTTACGGGSVNFNVVSTNGVNLPPNTQVSWNFGGGIVVDDLSIAHSFTNFLENNIGQNITAQVIGFCNGNSNIANTTITILPQPPASLSLNMANNAFCNVQDIYAELTVASSTTGITFQWFKDNVIIPNQFGSSLIVNSSLGFGNYTFIATNANGCSTVSNIQSIIQSCGSVGCLVSPQPNIYNISTQSCGLITLVGGADQNAVNPAWLINGPTGLFDNYTNTTFLASKAGVYHTFYFGTFTDANGNTCRIASEPKDVVVPYIPNFAYNALCDDNNAFTVNLTDTSSVYALVQGYSVNYSYRQGTTGAFLPVTGTTFTTTNAGVYQIKMIVQGFYDGNLEDACEKIITTDFLGGVPNNSINITNLPQCYDTAVGFELINNTLLTDTLLWIFEPGTTNETSSTVELPSRVFPTSGNKIVTVIVTNKFGCSRTFTTTVTIPEKCFNGTITSNPANATVCQGVPVLLQYTPNSDVCNATQFTWMNGLNQVATTTIPSLSVTDSGIYWVKVKTNTCEYATPNRATPIFTIPPTISLTSPSATCLGEDVVIKAATSAAYLQWQLNGVAQTAYNNLSTATFTALPVGSHTVSVTVFSGIPGAPNTCFATTSQTITIKPIPDTPVITQQVFCAGQDPSMPYYHVNLTATSNFNSVFTWSNGMQGSSITAFDGGAYQVRISNGGCNATAQIMVPKNPEDYIWVFPNGCFNLCEKENGLASLIGPRLPFAYWSWNLDGAIIQDGGDSFVEPIILQNSGSYSLNINTGECRIESEPLNANINRCDKCDIQDVSSVNTEFLPENNFCSFLLTFQVTSSNGFDAMITAPNDELYLDPSSIAILPGTNTYTTTAVPLGNFNGGQILFEIKGFLNNGAPCISTFIVDLPSCNPENNKFSTSKTTSTTEENSTIAVQLQPNPATEQVTVQYQNLPKNTSFEVYDLLGKLLDTQAVNQTNGNLQLNTSRYAAGIYIVVAKNNGVVLRQEKLIIKK
jgi:hypothetical protein